MDTTVLVLKIERPLPIRVERKNATVTVTVLMK